MKTLFQRLFLLLFLCNIGLYAAAQDNCDNEDCLTQGIDLSTGVDHANNNNPIAIGQQDTYWELVNSPTGTTGTPWVINPDPQQAHPFGSAIGSGQWISVSQSGFVDEHNPAPDQPYTFRRCFCVCDGEAFLENVRVFGTDEIAEIRINGNPVYTSTYTPWSPNDYQAGVGIPDQPVTPEDGQICIEIDVRKRVFNELPLGLMFFGQVSGNNLLRPECCNDTVTDGCEALSDECRTNTLNVSTGVNHNTGNLYAANNPATDQDAYWSLTSVPGNSNATIGPAWVIPPGSSFWRTPVGARWIYAFRNSGFTEGEYTYERCFCLCEEDEVELDFTVFADDRVNSISIGNTSFAFTPTHSVFNHMRTGVTLTNPTVTLPEGRHCLEIKTQDLNQLVSGLLVEGTISSPSLVEDNCCAPTGSIGGFKFNDLNQNGVWDNQEPTMQGWTFDLSDGQFATTDVNGYYLFDNLSPNTYTVMERQKAGWQQSLPANNQPHTVTITGNQAFVRNFGNFEADNNNTITGKKFHDLNCDGIRQPSEPFLGGWHFDLYRSPDLNTIIKTAVSDQNGCFEFRDLPFGTYFVKERNETGWQQTFPNGGAMNEVNIFEEGNYEIEFGNCLVNDPDACCDDEAENMTFHEDFEQGAANFANGYSFGSVMNPGEYEYMNAAQASAASSNAWDVRGFNAGGNCNPNERFLVVNGRTRQTGTSQAYRSPVINTVKGKKYSVCVRFKDLPQCVFNTNPVVQLEVINWPPLTSSGGGAVYPPLYQSAWTTITTSSANCDYITISGTFIAGADFQGNSRTVISVLLDETANGDGNDLVIDEVLLQEIPKLDVTDVEFFPQGGSSPVPVPGTYELTVTPGKLLSSLPFSNCKEQWQVFERDANDMPIAGTSMSGTANTTPAWGHVTSFPGYNSIAPDNGLFEYNKEYRIIRTVDCDCVLKTTFKLDINPGLENTIEFLQVSTEGDGLGNEAKERSIEVLSSNSFSIRPNPFQSVFAVHFDEPVKTDGLIMVYNLSGQRVQVLDYESGVSSKEVDISTLPAGAYLLQVQIDGEVQTQKVIKQ